MSLLTMDQFKEALPDGMRKLVSQDLVDGVNKTVSDPAFYERYRENLLSYGSVMREGKFKAKSYVDAVRYVSFKLMGCTNQDAYIKTFPDKYQYFLSKGVSAKDISSYVSAYNKTKLVNLIFEQTMVPIHILNQDMVQKALNVQCELMLTATSEKVRSDAANSILTHLKPPEKKQVELNINTPQDGTLAALRAATEQLVQQQREMIQKGGATAGQIAGGRIIQGEVITDV